VTTRRKPKPKPKPGAGGAREGAGRPPLGAAKRDQVVKVLLTPAELAAAVVAAGQEPVAKWLQRLTLAELGLAPERDR